MAAAKSIGSGDHIDIYLPNATLSGNLVTVLLGIDGTGNFPTVTDDQSNRYSVAKSCTDSGNNTTMLLYAAANVTAGARKITVTYAATNQNGPAVPAVAEWTNLATSSPVDTTSCNNGSSSTVTAGSATPGQSGDLVIQYAWNDRYGTIGSGGGLGKYYTAGSQSNITWQMFLNAFDWMYGAQWGVYSSTSALNPAMTSSTSGFVSLSVFFKAASAGTAPGNGIRVLKRKDVMLTTGWIPSPLTGHIACPSSTNLLIADWGGPGLDLTNVSDSASNSWQSESCQDMRRGKQYLRPQLLGFQC